MALVFHPDAEDEFHKAIEHYEESSTGLGDAFADEVGSTVARIQSQPNAWSIVRPGIRRALVSRFPYGILYSYGGGDILIVAVMHQRQEPGYWESRI